MAVREAEPVGSLQEVRDAELDREYLLGIYRHLLITRGIEERGHILYKQGKIPGSFYTGRGNEAAAVGVATGTGPSGVGAPVQASVRWRPVATGMALAFNIRGDRRGALGWFGEGAAARGDAHESMNFAGVRRLPIVFVCDNNQGDYSQPAYLSY